MTNLISEVHAIAEAAERHLDYQRERDARDRREAQEALRASRIGTRSEPVHVSAQALPTGLAHIFRRHLQRHPPEKWRLTDDGTVRCGCSCGAQLELQVGAYACQTDGCDRVWIFSGRAVWHAHPEQIATDG